MNEPVKEIALLAIRQYQAWLALAGVWPLELDDGQQRCMACGIGVVSVADPMGVNRPYTREEVTSLIVGHLRNHHRDLEERVYKEAGIT